MRGLEQAVMQAGVEAQGLCYVAGRRAETRLEGARKAAREGRRRADRGASKSTTASRLDHQSSCERVRQCELTAVH